MESRQLGPKSSFATNSWPSKVGSIKSPDSKKYRVRQNGGLVEKSFFNFHFGVVKNLRLGVDTGLEQHSSPSAIDRAGTSLTSGSKLNFCNTKLPWLRFY